MTVREQITRVLRSCAAPAPTPYLAAALGSASRVERQTVWKTLRRMEALGEVSRHRTARTASSARHPNLSHEALAWRLTRVSVRRPSVPSSV